MEKMIEDLFNRGYAYDSFREEKRFKEIAPIDFPGSKTFDVYEGFEADVEFYFEKYCQDVMDGVNDPNVDAVEYIAGRIDEHYPTENPMQFDSLVREVRALLPKVEKNLSVNIREAQISGVMEYANGEASGRALAGENADKGIRDITDGPNGRGQAEVDRTGIYIGVPMGPDKTAWENPAAVQKDFPNVAKRAKAFQAAYKNAPEQEKSAMLDWTPEKPDMSMNLDGQVIDNNIDKVMKTQAAPQQQPKAKSSILQKLGFKESLFEEVLNASKLNESCSTSEDCDESILDKDYFWLRTHGYWCIDFETEKGHRFNLYANDMDPSKWFGQLSGSDGRNHTIYDIHSSKCYSELGSYDRPDSGTPRETFERTPYGQEKIVRVQANKPSIDLGKAVTYGVTISVKKKLCQLSYNAAADQLYGREIRKVLKPYGKNDGYETEYPEVDGNWELVDKLIAEAVENIKAEKKAAAAAKRAARESVDDDKSRLFESLIRINEASANVTANAIAKQFNNFDGTDAGAKELVNYISKFLGQANAMGEQGLLNDLPQFFQNHNGIENMILAAAAIRCNDVNAAFNFYKKYGNQLGANINPNVVAQAIQAAQQNQNLGLEQAQQQVQQ